MNKADKYLVETLQKLKQLRNRDVNPRPKYADGTPAHTYFETQKFFNYDIAAGELPLTTLRTTALKGSWFDMEAIYIKQTNILEEMHPSIKNWWVDFVVDSWEEEEVSIKSLYNWSYKRTGRMLNSLGATYGDTVKRYNLMNKLLKGLEENPFGRRHSINLNQEQQKIDDPSSLQPCAYETLWTVKEDKTEKIVDLTLIQRSQDYLVTSSINGIQYVLLGMAVCNHLTFKTGIKHSLGNFSHFVQNLHVYDRHLWALEELLQRKSTGLKPRVVLNCEPKDFYSHTWEDFSWSGLEGIKPLSKKLEIAI